MLVAGYKRDVIDIIVSRLTPEQKNQGQLSVAQVEQLVLEYILRKHC